eukprot:5067607-Prymnesium_polylepis.1
MQHSEQKQQCLRVQPCILAARGRKYWGVRVRRVASTSEHVADPRLLLSAPSQPASCAGIADRPTTSQPTPKRAPNSAAATPPKSSSAACPTSSTPYGEPGPSAHPRLGAEAYPGDDYSHVLHRHGCDCDVSQMAQELQPAQEFQ